MPRVGGRRNARRRSPPPKVQALDYATWQLSKQKIKPFVPLPVTHKSGHKKSKMKIIDQPDVDQEPTNLTPGALQSGELPHQAQSRTDQYHQGHGRQLSPENTRDAAAAGHLWDLKQQVEQLNDKLKKTQEEVNFLSTYMDHEYPVKVVQIANLLHQLEQVKDNQQDELDDFNKIGKVVLESLSDQIQMKKQKLVRSLVAKMQRPRQAFLLHRTQENQNMAKYADKYREFISQFEEKIPKLRAEVEQLRARAREPREVAFADVLLRRPRCTPDMDVTLSIPVEELLPF
ncbi:uncharacterized protein C20orf96 homolog isoform X3 [Pipistrellus kuhlii]|uniref:uncharacterized protein C20orf96 homolog isoform X3 n=1 Tax=Pipistrellus kuhlii TaxID=59472 RepID=UPI001E274C7B|nr:uncharacterized protein C20orf96 homolog isoform X3 [Pipistrellus kuhlii]